MKRLPLVPTLFVAAAIAVMIGLGVWQLQRLRWKQDLLARYAAAQGLPAVVLPLVTTPNPNLLFRRGIGDCRRVTEWRVEGGHDLKGRSGWIHLAGCNGRNARPGFRVVLGWSDKVIPYTHFEGGRVEGIIAPDRGPMLRLVLSTPPATLQPAKPPSLEDVPNNHLFYAVQWFFFAAAAAVIYLLALRRRSR